jgi:hypothetical protein
LLRGDRVRYFIFNAGGAVGKTNAAAFGDILNSDGEMLSGDGLIRDGQLARCRMLISCFIMEKKKTGLSRSDAVLPKR